MSANWPVSYPIPLPLNLSTLNVKSAGTTSGTDNIGMTPMLPGS